MPARCGERQRRTFQLPVLWRWRYGSSSRSNSRLHGWRLLFENPRPVGRPANVDQLSVLVLVGACLPFVDERQRQLLPRRIQVASPFVEQGERAPWDQPGRAARLRQRTCLHGSAITTGSDFVAAAIAAWAGYEGACSGRSGRADLGEPRCALGVHRQEGLDREVRRRDVERSSESGDDREQLDLAGGGSAA